jgi:hypothetical protein
MKKINSPSIFLFFLLSLVFQHLSFAQKVSMNDILATARKDIKYQQSQELSEFVRGLNYGLPLLQKVEMRFGADENSFQRNQYGLGLGFNTLAQRKAQFRFQAKQAKVYEAEGEIAFQNALLERYNTIVQFVHLQRVVAEQQQLLDLFSQKKEIMRAMLERGQDVKVKDVAQNEADEYDVTRNKAQNERDFKLVQQQLTTFWGSSNLDIDTTNFVNEINVEQQITFLNLSGLNSPETAFRNSQIEATKTELQIEKQSNTQIISNLQFGVQEDDRVPLWQNPYFRLGIRLPIIQNNRFKYNDYALNMKVYEQKIKLEEHQQNLTLPLLKNNLLETLAIYKKQREQQQKSLIRVMLNNEKLSAEITAFERLELLIIEQKRALDIQKLAYSIAQDYLNLLHQSGVLVAKPLKNYLRNDLIMW